MKNNILCKMLDIKYPIIQGAMAWIADSSLASAVSNAGGLGVLSTGNLPINMVKDEIRKIKEMTDKPFGVNIMLLSDNADKVAEIVCEEDIKVVTTGAGSPGKYIDMWKKSGVKIIPVVASVAMAKRMERSGVDAVIAEGCEAGGHIGEITTMALIPQVVDAVNIPVIAAGGIGDNRGVAAAFMLGASGVQVGTRFLVAKECRVHKNYKDKVLKAKDIDTVVTGRSTGHPVRVLRNKLSRKFQKLENKSVSMEQINELGKGALVRAVKEGDVDFGSVMAGQISGLISKEATCKEIIEEMFDFSSLKNILEKFI